jgi:hypothetical protein
LIILDAAVNPAVLDHLLAIHWHDPLHIDNRTTTGSVDFSYLRWRAVDSPPGDLLLTSSGVPDHMVTELGTLRHLPAIDRVTGSDPICQFGDILGFLIHLKYMNFDHKAFQSVRDRRQIGTLPPQGSVTLTIGTNAPGACGASNVFGRQGSA